MASENDEAGETGEADVASETDVSGEAAETSEGADEVADTKSDLPAPHRCSFGACG